jgi:GT2 family glycosyltransferase
MTDFDIVIVNYKSAAHTVKCVESVHRVARADGLSARIFVVNNGDDAGALDSGVAAAGGAEVIHSPSNIGFGAASNLGAKGGDAPLIFFLNPDARLEPGALRQCLSFLDSSDSVGVGIVGPELSDANGQLVASCSRLPTAADLILRSTGAHVVFKSLDYPYLSLAKHQASGHIGQVMGAAMVVRRALFTALGGFDPAFFLYYEDVDLCARAAAMGAGCYYLKEAKAIHIGRASSSQDTGMTLALHVRSRLIYARRHFGPVAYAALLATCWLIEFPLRLARTFAGNGSPRAVLRAYRILSWPSAS